MAIPSQVSKEEGVETVRETPRPGEETVQTTNPLRGNENCSGKVNHGVGGSRPSEPAILWRTRIIGNPIVLKTIDLTVFGVRVSGPPPFFHGRCSDESERLPDNHPNSC